MSEGKIIGGGREVSWEDIDEAQKAKRLKQNMIKLPEFHSKTWGREVWLCNTSLYCGKLLIVEKDKFCSLHAHILKTEDFYVRQGRIKFEYCQGAWCNDVKAMVIDGQRHTIDMQIGDVVHVPPLLLHRFTGLDDVSEIIEISTQHHEDDSYRVEPSYQPPTPPMSDERLAEIEGRVTGWRTNSVELEMFREIKRLRAEAEAEKDR